MSKEYLRPGVFVEEIPSGAYPIEGVGTSTAGFVGIATRGALNKPMLVTNWSQFVKHFGDYRRDSYLAYAVYGFFLNKGKRCFVTRVVSSSAKIASALLSTSGVQGAVLRIYARAGVPTDPMSWVHSYAFDFATGTNNPDTEYKMTILRGGTQIASWDNLSMDSSKSNFIETVINQDPSTDILVEKLDGQTATPTQFPVNWVEGDELIIGLGSEAVDILRVQALNEGEWGNGLSIDIADGKKDPTNEFKITVKENGSVVEVWDDLSMDSSKENYIENVIAGKSNYIQVDALANNRPQVQSNIALSGGLDGISDITDSDYIGSETTKFGLYAFNDVDEVNSIAIPGLTSQTVVQAGLDYCSGRGDCGFVADCPPNQTPQETKAFRELFDSSYGYYYYPRILINDPLTKTTKLIPVSGHIMGIFARSDGERGVHKAPANEVVYGAIGLEYNVTDGEQEILNPAGVNCIRSFRGRGIRVWGARTMSSNPNLRYIHKRRFLMFIEESIAEGTQWAVFEPNDEVLWGKIIRSASAFLKRQWLEGALFGVTPEEAFYVKCDIETNPSEVRQTGQVITEIGVNIVETAEFVIFRIGQWDGGKEIIEMS